MQHVVNGVIVEVFTEPDGSVSTDAIRRAAGIPEGRPLVLQTPNGGNTLVNPGENIFLTSSQFFVDAPLHKSGHTVAYPAGGTER